ncbi:UDP-glucose 4-epimerase GalE [Pseudomonas sp. TH10]|uniref:UDP-glucose 4-epimerase GalE n=1 Tax=Pseudomonas sp. TH10 TaxID=2796376 RepID=UPI001911DCA5|nr:UDP-glucose 4-epimerase GalE [Pseudomonas sp. TH10]MBK5518837.1 UDP-glucose 4-epimerase GalE [Pseudomonas sp. TH10]
MSKQILITGGAGYIGSHTTVSLLEAGHEVVIIDNLSNSSIESINRIQLITGKSPIFIEGDIRDTDLLDRIFTKFNIEAVLHFAGLKAVGESVEDPIKYYSNNVCGSLSLFQAMAKADVFRLVFSSSATVYGEPDNMPISEDFLTGTPTNPYGKTKLVVEQIIADLVQADRRWSIASLRYFNPVGAHPSGLIGEDPQGIPNNLLPYISRVAIGELAELSVFGNDYATPDGTGIRDYIHVVDLAKGHLKSLHAIFHKTGMYIWNLGTGKGYSVLEMIAAFEKASGKSIAYRIAPRRAGDIAECWANPSKAAEELLWEAELGLDDMMIDTWRWQSSNPQGYDS